MQPLLAALFIAVAPQALVAQQAPASSKGSGECAACKDFYEHVNSEWIGSTRLPPDRVALSNFSQLADATAQRARSIVEDAAARRGAAAPGSATWQMGTFYASCMDSAAATRAGAAPLRPDLDRIAAMRSSGDLAPVVARLKKYSFGVFFSMGIAPDDRRATELAVIVSQGGLTLPSRDAYLRTDSTGVALRASYRTHIERTARLLGDDSAGAAAEAERVLRMETALARGAVPAVQQADPLANHNRLDLAELQRLTPHFDWPVFLRESGLAVTSVVVRQPGYLRALDSLIVTAPLRDWQAYLRWRFVKNALPWLGASFEAEEARWQGASRGVEALPPRDRRCYAATENALGELIGQEYVRRWFPPEAKERATRFVRDLQSVLRTRIQSLAWMSPETKQAALAKLSAMRIEVGYPEKWRDYRGLDLRSGAFVMNYLRAEPYSETFWRTDLGRPVNRSQWAYRPTTVSAAFIHVLNQVEVPAAMLQAPFYTPGGDDASNFGALGAIIGHELTHAFDSRGRRYDANGELRDWWTKDDAARFDSLAQVLVAQYDRFVAIDTVRVNGRLTLPENIADLGGLTVAWAAFQRASTGQPASAADGLSPAQRFFTSWARTWRFVIRPELLRETTPTESHPVPKFRVNGPLPNMPEFAEAFGCTPGDPMSLPVGERVRFW
ncbi:MAG TPA: M13 family metallopeptidase [Longimicrobium sp.]|jgi:putative endopeptidase